MPWIESHTILGRHKKVFETARSLRIRPVYLIGHLHLLWHAALEQAESGDLTDWSDELIAEVSSWPADAPTFVRRLLDHGWLDDTRRLHDWLDYAGRYLISKYKGTPAGRERLKEIWAIYGKVYGNSDLESDTEKADKKPSPPLGGHKADLRRTEGSKQEALDLPLPNQKNTPPISPQGDGEGVAQAISKIKGTYPNTDPHHELGNGRHRSTGKSVADDKIIERILREGKYPLEWAVELFVLRAKRTGQKIPNFGKFLKNLPDIEDLKAFEKTIAPLAPTTGVVVQPDEIMTPEDVAASAVQVAKKLRTAE